MGQEKAGVLLMGIALITDFRAFAAAAKDTTATQYACGEQQYQYD
jgi:hypothetical protein